MHRLMDKVSQQPMCIVCIESCRQTMVAVLSNLVHCLNIRILMQHVYPMHWFQAKEEMVNVCNLIAFCVQHLLDQKARSDNTESIRLLLKVSAISIEQLRSGVQCVQTLGSQRYA